MSEEQVEEVIFAEVEMLCRTEYGDYVRTYVQTHGSVTFSVHPNVWKEIQNPAEGEVVVLSELRYMSRKGWRAENARRPSPEEIEAYLKR